MHHRHHPQTVAPPAPHRALPRRRRAAAAALPLVGAVAALGLLGGCTFGESGSAAPTADGGSPGAAAGGTVVLITHDSFNVSPDVLAQFEQETGYDVDVRALGDAGTLVSQLVLAKDAPLGDAVFGIDNTFASRAIDAGVLEPYASGAVDDAVAEYRVDGSDALTPVDKGDVCVNVDHAWFTEHGIPEPTTLDSLADPAYRDLLVVENPATSSPGLAFLLATVGAFGEDGWAGYWQRLRDNGVQVAASWSDAYYVDFSGSTGAGPRPLVVSYASSPPAEMAEGDTTAPTGALLDTCFRQVEYAGVLAGAKNSAGAKALIDFMLGDAFQADVPGQMYVYPVKEGVALPAGWDEFAPLAPSPFHVEPADIATHRDAWIEQWTTTVVG